MAAACETLSSPPCECTQKYDTLSLSSLQGKHIFTFSATVDCMDSNIWYSLFHRCQEGFTHAACFCMLLLGTQFAFSSAFSHKFSYLLVLHYLHITVSSSFSYYIHTYYIRNIFILSSCYLHTIFILSSFYLHIIFFPSN